MEDAEQLVAWLREAADELEKAHAYLDEVVQVPRKNPGTDRPFTLAARIAYMDGVREYPEDLPALAFALERAKAMLSDIAGALEYEVSLGGKISYDPDEIRAFLEAEA